MKKLFYVWVFVVLLGAFYSCDSRADDTTLWLARSCIGEAGWNSWNTGECAAILHIYKKRSEITGQSILKQASQYSSAIKDFKGKRNRWVLNLKENAGRPKHWPSNLNWKKYKVHWIMTMIFVEMFLHDMTVDPIPNAVHYGCSLDTPPKGTKKIKTNYRNIFYRR